MLHAHTARLLAFGFVTVVLFTAGCGKIVPAVTEVQGVVLLDNKPLPNAKVEFLPEIEVGPEWISTGITDKDGKFTLTMPQKDDAPGMRFASIASSSRMPPAPKGAEG